MKEDVIDLRITPRGEVEWRDSHADRPRWYPLATTVEEAVRFLINMTRTSSTVTKWHLWETTKHESVVEPSEPSLT